MIRQGFIVEDNIKMNATTVSNQVKLVCPVCKSQKELNLPESILNQSGNLTTISVPHGLVCDHHFQAFLDKQFKVRGYQRVDFEIKQDHSTAKHTEEQKDTLNNEERDFYDNLILEGNYLEYKPKNNKNPFLDEKKRETLVMGKNEMSLEEIYEEFWEFIDDDNYEFKELILKDVTRRKALKSAS